MMGEIDGAGLVINHETVVVGGVEGIGVFELIGAEFGGGFCGFGNNMGGFFALGFGEETREVF